jgi:polyhydroxyalkanoate synthesis regulator phasin
MPDNKDILKDLSSPDDVLLKKYPQLKGDKEALADIRAFQYGLSKGQVKPEEFEDYFPQFKPPSKFEQFVKEHAPEQHKLYDQRQKERAEADKFPLGDFSKPPTEKKVAESTKGPQILPVEHTGTTVEQAFINKTAEAHKRLRDELAKNNDVLASTISKNKYANQLDAGLDKAVSNRTDATAVKQNIPQELIGRTPSTKATQDDILSARQAMKTDVNSARAFVSDIDQQYPDKKLSKDLYLVDAAESLKENNSPGRQQKILKNAKGMEDGELIYNPVNGTVVKPAGPVESAIHAWNEKFKSYDRYKEYTSLDNPTAKINLLNEWLTDHDPDEPTVVPKGLLAGATSGVAGSPVKGMAIGAAAGALTRSPQVGGWVTGLASARDFYRLGYYNELLKTYSELKNQGMSDIDAMTKAEKQADYAGNTDAASGMVLSVAGAHIGTLPKISPAFTSSVMNGIKKTAGVAALKGLEAGAVGGLMGESQRLKNINAQELGSKRTTGEGVAETQLAMIELVGVTALAHGLGNGTMKLTGKTGRAIVDGYSRMQPEKVEKIVQQHIQDGSITEEDAKPIVAAITKERELNKTIDASFPNVTDEARNKIKDKIERRNELEEKLDVADKSIHPEVKEKVKEVNEEIKELAKDKAPPITKEVKEKLAEKGLSEEEIKDVRPSEVEEILKQKSVEPSIEHGGIKLVPKKIKEWVRQFIGDGEEVYSAKVEDLDAIKKFETNEPQHPSEENVSTIKDEGLKSPLVIAEDKDGNRQLQQGHHRLEEAKKLGATELPVVVVKTDTPLPDNSKQISLKKLNLESSTKAAPVSPEETKENVLKMAEADIDSGYDFGLDIPNLSRKDRIKAAADIRSGKESAAAKKLQAEIDKIHQTGNISLLRGRGAHVERVDFPAHEWFKTPLTKEELNYTEDIADPVIDYFKNKGVTLETLDEYKNLFDGFPYDESDFAKVKTYLSGQSEVHASNEATGTESQGSRVQEEINPQAGPEESVQPPQEPTPVVAKAKAKKARVKTKEDFKKGLDEIIGEKSTKETPPAEKTSDEQEKIEYARRNSYRFFKAKYPDISVDDFNRLRFKAEEKKGGLAKVGEDLQDQKSKELQAASKPKVSMEFIEPSKLNKDVQLEATVRETGKKVGVKVSARERHSEIKASYKILKQLIDCVG